MRDGVLVKDGRPFRACGINAIGLADEILARGESAAQGFRAIEFLGRHKVPFVRFWASYFDNWKPYREDPRRYWHNMDLLVGACERANLGLIPTLFWNAWDVPFDFGEYRFAWLDDESRTRRFAAEYTREFVRRYRGRSIVWAWEFANEDNLAWDLPNGIAHLPAGRKDNRNLVRAVTGIVAVRAFAREVRALDGRRPISSGASEVRPAQYRIASVPLQPGEHWGEDTPEQALEATAWTAPAPVDLLSMHHYEPPERYNGPAARAWLRTAGERAAALKRPLFLGEFGMRPHGDDIPADFDDAAYRAALGDLFDALYESRAALAAYWAFTLDARRFPGAVAPDSGRFNYVFDLIAAFNRKCAARERTR